MSKRLKQKIQSSKLYNNPHWLSLACNNDLSHEKLWSQKVQQTKHIQQQKQIDRILFGIVKERLFGQLLSQDTRISNEGFYALDKLNKELVNPVVVKNSRKIWPLANQPAYDIVGRSRLKYRTIDGSQGQRSRSTHHVPNEDSSDMTRSIEPNPLRQTRKIFFTKSITASKMPNLQTHFRELTNNQATMLYDIKLTKQMLVKYNKNKAILTNLCLQKFLHFFHFGGPYNFKQFCSWIEGVFNCAMRQSCFVVFQILDQSKNGYLTISDIFQGLQDFQMVSSSILEKEIYQLMEKIKQTDGIKLQQIKPTVEEIIVRNHNIKLEEMRQLLKQSSKELVSANTFKSTAYHKSMYALQHTAASRQKNSKIQYTETDQSLGDKLRRIKGEKREQGLRFSQYVNFFANKRSLYFLLFAKLLLGQDAAVVQ